MNGSDEALLEELVDYTPDIEAVRLSIEELQGTVEQLSTDLDTVNTFLGYISGFLLFAVVVALCVFGYKFLRIFI